MTLTHNALKTHSSRIIPQSPNFDVLRKQATLFQLGFTVDEADKAPSNTFMLIYQEKYKDIKKIKTAWSINNQHSNYINK